MDRITSFPWDFVLIGKMLGTLFHWRLLSDWKEPTTTTKHFKHVRDFDLQGRAELNVPVKICEVMMDGKLYWKCEDCDFTTTAKRNAALHYRTIHLGVYKYQCTICGKGFQERNRVRSHMMAQHGLEKIYKCHLCPTTFTLKASLVRHLKGHGQAPLNLKKTSTEDISTKLGSEK